ncbi:MAG: hypothetical protein HDR38_06695 [Treponema sp.]|nr:hypothetical protein [Treponema sp.]
MMKKLSKIALLAAASAFMLAVFPACGDDDDGDDDPSVKIVTEQSTTVEVDGTIDLMASVSNFPEGEVTYDWKSDKTDIATVAQNPENKAQARVTAVTAGTAKITVTATVGETEKSADVTVTVTAKGSNPDPATPTNPDEGDEGKPAEITFPLSIKPTTEGSTPAYPTDADISSNSPFVFTSPVSYTVCTKKKFDTGKYNTGSEIKTESRWNLGGALKSSSGSYNCYMKFDSAPSAKMTVKFFNTNADRTITVISGEAETVGTVKTTKSDGTNGDLMSETFTVTKGSEVYLGATANGIWVAEIIWEE